MKKILIFFVFVLGIFAFYKFKPDSVRKRAYEIYTNTEEKTIINGASTVIKTWKSSKSPNFDPKALPPSLQSFSPVEVQCDDYSIFLVMKRSLQHRTGVLIQIESFSPQQIPGAIIEKMGEKVYFISF